MNYTYKDKYEVHKKACEIVGRDFGDLSKILKIKKTKNSVGDLFEAWFGKSKDSASAPDLGVAELKATPYKKLKNGQYSAKERLVLNIINYMDIVNENFDSSHFLYKNKVIELAFYEYIKATPRDKWSFSNVALYEMEMNPVDFAIIHKDWLIIQQCVRNGKAEELSESMTSYLSACTKGANANSVRKQPYSIVDAKQRAFSLKSSYMTQLLRKYILGDKKIESIITDQYEAEKYSLSDIIKSRFSPYIGKNTKKISRELNILKNESKQFNKVLVRGMLGLNTENSDKINHINELNKASFQIKTIQFDVRGVNKESMSLPAFKFKDLASQSWVDSDGAPSANLNLTLSESKFIFVVFQKNKKGENIFKGVKFFTIPEEDINGDIKKVWQDTKNKINTGVNLIFNGKKVENNFVNKKDNMIIHVRPHSGKASYVESTNSNKLPTPAKWENKPSEYSNVYMTNQCFFINSNYIKKAVKDLID